MDTNRYYHIAKHKEPARLNNSNGAMNMGVGVRPLAEQGWGIYQGCFTL